MPARVAAAISALILLAACSSAPAPTLPSTPFPTPAPVSTPAPTPTQPPTQPPTPSVHPTPTSSPTVAPIPSTGGAPAPLAISADQIGAHLDALQAIADANNGIRAAGTPGYDGSASYVADQLTQMGYRVERDPFAFTFYDEAAPVTLSVGDQSWSGAEWLHSMLYAPAGDVTAPVQSVGIKADGYATATAGCDAADWANFALGDIALIESGPCRRRDQITLAQTAGAVGVIAVYPGWAANETRRPTLIDPSEMNIPAIAAGAEPAAALLAAGHVGGSAHFHVLITTSPATNYNIVATWPGASTNTVMLGAHLDSVLDGPGINDNGSGVATLLSLASSIPSSQLPQKSVRLGFWGAEEYGDLGSAAYVGSLDSGEIGQIGAYINIDMDASPAGERLVYDEAGAPPGSDQLTQQLLGALAAAGKPGLTVDLGWASDHNSFAQAGVPIGGVFSGLSQMTKEQVAAFGGTLGQPADPCYHLSCDTRSNINMDSALTLGGAVATVVQQLAYQP